MLPKRRHDLFLREPFPGHPLRLLAGASLPEKLALGVDQNSGARPVATGIVHLSFAQGTQEGAIPTPGPDHKVFVGRVPAPPGTSVRLEVLDVANARPVLCAQGVTFASTEDSASTSTFALVLERACLQAGYENVRVCWGDNLCDLVLPLSAATFRGGETIQTNLLDGPIEIPAVLPSADSGQGAPSLPPTGGGIAGDSYAWLLWAGLAAFGAGLGLSLVSRTLRRR